MLSLAALEAYMGETAFERWRERASNPESALEQMNARLLAAILPRVPEGDEQQAAFTRAAYAQLAHEAESGLPEGVVSYSAGAFSCRMDRPAPGLCRAARAELLAAGLMCREVLC